MNPLGYILLSGALGVAGQLILKRAVVALGPLALRLDAIPGVMLALALSPLVILGLAVYLSGTFFWLLALSRADLSYAYPFASLNYVLVLASSWWLLGEQPTPTRIAGVIVICFGVWAISRTPARTIGREPRRPTAPAAAVMGGPER
jgi:drug/metabolite transporter (DMT)-like permease